MKPLVYIAGPYTKPDPVTNTRKACLVADEVAAMGAGVIVPHLSLLWHAISPAPIETWYARDLDVLRRCQIVVQIPGESTGADAEIEEACRLGIPIYTWPVAKLLLARHLADPSRWCTSQEIAANGAKS